MKLTCNNRRGDMAIGIAVIFSVVTISIIVSQNLISSQKLKTVYRVSEEVSSFSFNEINAWRLFYRNKAGLPLNTPLTKGSTTTTVGGVTTVHNFFPTEGSGPGSVVAPGPGVTSKFCGASASAGSCIGEKPASSGPPLVGWNQQAYIKASNAHSGDVFGDKISLSGDTVAVGAYIEGSSSTSIINGPTASSDTSAVGTGAVYIFKRTGTTWAQEAYIKAGNGEANDFFGFRVALNGDTLAVGSCNEGSNQTTITNGTTTPSDNMRAGSGAVYVYKRTGTNWAQQAYIKASNAAVNDHFGMHGVSLDGDTLVVASLYQASGATTITSGTTADADNSQPSSGAVYVFKRTGTNWSQEAYIKSPNGLASMQFGIDTSISGNTLAVGQYCDPSGQTGITTTVPHDFSLVCAGSALVFVRAGVNWALQAYLKPPNVDINDQFGHTLSLDGDNLAVAGIHEASNLQTIINGNTASTDNSISNSGAVYVFTRAGVNWTQQAFIKASNNTRTDAWFGYQAVSLKADLLAVGANRDASNQSTITNGSTSSSNTSTPFAGAVFVYRRTGTNWAQEAYIKASNCPVNKGLGYSVSADGSTIAAGMYNDASSQQSITNGSSSSTDTMAWNSGAAFVYKKYP